jgi:hypothetical protein
MKNVSYFLNFFVFNLLIISFLQAIILKFWNGSSTNPYPWKTLFTMLIINILIIAVQYPILNLKPGWLYKSIIFFVSMIVFLFVYGVVQNLQSVNPQYGLIKIIDVAMAIVAAGSLFAGIWVYPFVVLANWLARKQLFNI